jgi:two-component system CheB/CheR fusion protein
MSNADAPHLLLDVVRDLSLARELDAVTCVVRKAARALTGADGVTFVLRDKGQCYYADEDAIAPLWKGQRFAMESCISGWTMLHRTTAAIPDIYADERIPHEVYRPTFVKSLAMVPVRRRDPVAAIGAYWARAHEPTVAELEVLQSLADAAALALENVELYSNLRNALESERDARSAAEAANRSKDEFLANLSHELRTPLAVIQGWCWQLRQGLPPEAIGRAAEVIERNVALQTRLVEDLLDTSRALAGKLKLQTRLVDLSSAVRVVVEASRPAADEKAIGLTIDDEGPDSVVWADSERLQQVVWNLVNNAIKFTPRGGSVRVAVGRAGTRARIEVRDTGSGIPAEALPRVFERFHQADQSSTRRYGGLGLGLTIARELIEMHGGTLRGESEGEGRGAAFTIELPIPAVLEEPGSWLRRRVGAPASSAARLDGTTIMIVDDEKDACESIRAILERQGARVVAAHSAAEALTLLQESPPDLLVADLAMPEMDGYDLLRKVRQLDSSVHDVPAAALTAFFGPEHEQAARAAGFQLFLPKPIGAQELAAELAQLASGRASWH